MKFLITEFAVKMMDFPAIDLFLSKLDEATDDDHLRQIFNEYSAEYDLQTPSDPFSQEYLSFQIKIYKDLALKDYSNLNEITHFDVKEMAKTPFPYCHQSYETVGDTLLAIGFLIKKMALPKGAAILEFGPGWGNTSVELAKTGYLVTAVDIEKNFVDLINSRAIKEDLPNLKAIHGDFFDIDKFDEKFDVVLFFESFHHCADHNLLLEKIGRVLKPGGKIVFGAEPITKDFPLPWGLRMDGQSLWAIRKNGWLELGFNRNYFTKAINRINMVIEYHDGSDGPWSQVAIAQRAEDAILNFTPESGQLRTQIGSLTPSGIEGGSDSGFLLFGPHKSLPAGTYEVTIHIDTKTQDPVPLILDVVSSAGQNIHAQSHCIVTKDRTFYKIEFSLKEAVLDFEARLHSTTNTTGLLLSNVIIKPII